MSYAKTMAGRDALRRRDLSLNAQERQLLIVCNGRRDAAELGRIMCAPMDDVIERLIALGYLGRVDSLVDAHFSETGTIEYPPQAMPAHRDVPAEAAPLHTRRSMAGAKMYLLAVLDLQRGGDAAALARGMHAAASFDAFLDVAATCISQLCDRNGISYVRRMVRKLGQVLPEPHVSAFARRLRESLPAEVVGAFIDEASRTMPLHLVMPER